MADPDWPWLTRSFILALHDRLIAEHGGAGGLRDDGLLDSALARPRQLAAYDDPGACELAAAYAAAFVSSHPFVDGNKRIGFMAAYTFLHRVGSRLAAPEAEAVRFMQGLAAGEVDADTLADWLAANVQSQD